MKGFNWKKITKQSEFYVFLIIVVLSVIIQIRSGLFFANNNIVDLIREYGGFDALLGWIHKIFRGKKGGQLGMGLLVGAMDIATANNTVAIVMANPIAKEMAQEYGITPRKTASILDTFSCIFQGIIPYGAQMLVAISAVNELGGEISAFQIMPKLYYPMFLLLASIVTILKSDRQPGSL